MQRGQLVHPCFGGRPFEDEGFKASQKLNDPTATAKSDPGGEVAVDVQTGDTIKPENGV